MPIPYTGRSSRRRGHCFRRIRTAQARRQAQVIEPHEPRPRAARGLRGIPTAWDDFSISAMRDRCWKRHRAVQHKAPAASS